jgi:hypothetical protein
MVDAFYWMSGLISVEFRVSKTVSLQRTQDTKGRKAGRLINADEH